MDMSKLSRPLVVFVGVGVFTINYCVLPIILRLCGKDSTPFVIPESVILGWFGFLGIYSAGRSVEKVKNSEVSDENK